MEPKLKDWLANDQALGAVPFKGILGSLKGSWVFKDL